MNPAYSQAAPPPPVSYAPHGAGLAVSMAPHDAHGRPTPISTYAPVSSLPTLSSASYHESYSGRPSLDAAGSADGQDVLNGVPQQAKNVLEPISKDDDMGRKYRLVAYSSHVDGMRLLAMRSFDGRRRGADKLSQTRVSPAAEASSHVRFRRQGTAGYSQQVSNSGRADSLARIDAPSLHRHAFDYS